MDDFRRFLLENIGRFLTLKLTNLRQTPCVRKSLTNVRNEKLWPNFDLFNNARSYLAIMMIIFLPK